MNCLSLSDIEFNQPLESIINKNAIPPKFSACSFDNYIPDDNFPSQRQAKQKLIHFVEDLSQFVSSKKGLLKRFFAKKPKHIYLDGVFGVGKTHLLAAIGNTFKGKTIFISFSELMYLIAYSTLKDVADRFSSFDLILLDEFEIDDPGDAMMGINFIREINKTDTVIAATSNTLPSQLGARKLDMLVFKTRMGSLINSFETIVIDGKDYRIKSPKINSLNNSSTLKDICINSTSKKQNLYTTFDNLLDVLENVHPVRYKSIAEAAKTIYIENIHPLKEKDLLNALRFTYLIDILYYYDVEIFATSTCDLFDIFHNDLKSGKFNTKIGRCISRLAEKATIIKY
ncbi:AFG1/ZapE family ATPase [Hippea jasoniae]|uniref:AFG1/ZapE family ATPase n=1 Tax=Hippea jasoniae TaxID=944479 RepID=UPI0005554931|nr:AFG1/ZapE family ATPase [Hippea jasoniae]